MLNFNEVRDNAQNGYYAANGVYVGAGTNTNISTSVGWTHLYRFSTMIPLGATVTAAALKIPIGAKDGNANYSVSYTVSMQSSGNSPALVEGEQADFRAREGSIAKTVTYTSSTNTWSDYNVDVLSLVNSFMGKTNYIPGSYIMFALNVTAETGDINLGVDYKPFGGDKPSLSITYTPVSNGIYTEFNIMDNGAGTTDTNWWGENDVFGTFNTGGTIAIDNTVQRIAGRSTLKYTLPASNPDSKPGNVMHGVLMPGDNKTFVFSGWIYIPASITSLVYPQFIFAWDSSNAVTQRDQWVQFCSSPYTVGANPSGQSASISFDTGYSGQSIWLSDCAVYESNFRQTPWSGEAADTNTVDNNYTWRAGRGVQTRIIRPKLNHTTTDSTGFKPVRKYTLRSDGMWKLVETTRESISWDDLDTNGMTWDQLRATGKTWDQLEADITI